MLTVTKNPFVSWGYDEETDTYGEILYTLSDTTRRVPLYKGTGPEQDTKQIEVRLADQGATNAEVTVSVFDGSENKEYEIAFIVTN